MMSPCRAQFHRLLSGMIGLLGLPVGGIGSRLAVRGGLAIRSGLAIGSRLAVCGRLRSGGGGSLSLDLAELSLVDGRRITLRIMETGHDEEDDVHDGQDPDKSTETSAGTHSTAVAFIVVVKSGKAVGREKEASSGSSPSPAAQPENEAENVGNKGDDTIVEVGSVELNSESATVDDEGLDGIEDQETGSTTAVIVVAVVEDGNGIGSEGENDQRQHQDGDLDIKQPRGKRGHTAGNETVGRHVYRSWLLVVVDSSIEVIGDGERE